VPVKPALTCTPDAIDSMTRHMADITAAWTIARMKPGAADAPSTAALSAPTAWGLLSVAAAHPSSIVLVDELPSATDVALGVQVFIDDAKSDVKYAPFNAPDAGSSSTAPGAAGTSTAPGTSALVVTRDASTDSPASRSSPSSSDDTPSPSTLPRGAGSDDDDGTVTGTTPPTPPSVTRSPPSSSRKDDSGAVVTDPTPRPSTSLGALGGPPGGDDDPSRGVSAGVLPPNASNTTVAAAIFDANGAVIDVPAGGDVPGPVVAVPAGAAVHQALQGRLQVGRAHVCTPVTLRNHVCRHLLEKKNMMTIHMMHTATA
jgi:hypothetical protein